MPEIVEKFKKKAKQFFNRYGQKFADAAVIGSVFVLAGMQIGKDTAPSDKDYGCKFPLDNTTFSISPAYEQRYFDQVHAPETFKLVKYHVDTVTIDTAYIKRKFRGFAATDPVTNELTINHFVVNPDGMNPAIAKIETARANRYNSAENIYLLSLHEGTHQENADEGLKDYGISPKQFGKICIHDELIANISELLEIRDEYLHSGKLNEKYPFYAQALKNNEIAPDISKVPDDKEMSLIINGMRDWWQETNGDYYESKQIATTRNWLRRGFMKRLRERVEIGNIDERYNREYMSRLYNRYSFKITLRDEKGIESAAIINFLPFMNKDVNLSENFKNAIAAETSLSLKVAYDQYKKSLKDELRIKVESASRVKVSDAAVVVDRNISRKSFQLEKVPQTKITTIHQRSH